MGKFLLYSISLYGVLIFAYCQDEMMVLHSPPGLSFGGSEKLDRSALKHVMSTALGYSVDVENEWSGLEVKKPFGFAKAVYVLHFPGVKTFNSSVNSYPVITDEDMEKTWSELLKKTDERFPDKGSQLKKVVLGDEAEVFPFQNPPYVVDVSSDKPIESISSSRPNNENDNMLIKELNRIYSVTNKLLSESSKNGKPDLFWVTVPNIGQIMALRDGDSNEIMMNALTMLCSIVKERYNDKVLIVALTDNGTGKRSKRETTDKLPITLDSLNVAEDYDEDFPVIFNIVFWFSLAMLFAVIAICMVIGGMDPGRDSIIYRMTSTRMKKDN